MLFFFVVSGLVTLSIRTGDFTSALPSPPGRRAGGEGENRGNSTSPGYVIFTILLQALHLQRLFWYLPVPECFVPVPPQNQVLYTKNPDFQDKDGS